MRRFSVIFVSLMATYSSVYGQENCGAIQDPQARLACFDKAAASAKPPPSAKKSAAPAAPKASPGATVDGGWELRMVKDGFTDEMNCIISPIGKPWVQISVGNLYVSYKGRGGVRSYTLRIDDDPPGRTKVASRLELQTGMMHLTGDPFFEAVSGNRLRIQIFTLLSDLKNEDLELAPMKRLYKKMGPECERPKKR
jgi:hypothetical protein